MLKCLDAKIRRRGFTLLEVIIAIFLLTVGIVGIFVVINKTMSLMAASPSKLIAAYLAQEGIEIVRNIRDTNWVEGAPSWDEGLEDGDYEVDYDDLALTPCPDPCGMSNLSFLRINNDGFYNYDSGTEATKFKRKITISNKTDLDGDPTTFERMTVTVTVFWAEKGKSYSVTVQENLYNWH